MKTKARTQYTAEFKREALAMVASSEQTVPEVASALGDLPQCFRAMEA